MAHKTTQLLSALEAFFKQQGFERTYTIAYSGGLDSHVLLALCNMLQHTLPLRLRAVHVAHHMSPHTEQWLTHCRQIANQYGIPFQAATLLTETPVQTNIEATLRKARYAALANYLEADDMLLTAHHADDQVETVLLQLMRGASPKGLAGMPALKPFAKGWHGRPFLAFTREVLQKTALALDLAWIEDESNAYTHFARNYLRHEVLPLLKKRWPGLSRTVTRSAVHCRENHGRLTQLIEKELLEVQGLQMNTLSLSKLLKKDELTQRLLLREWITRSGFALPSSKKMQSIIKTIFTAPRDRQPQVDWGKVSLRRYQDDLYLLPIEASYSLHEEITWRLNEPLVLVGVGCLSAKQVQGRGLKLPFAEVTVRFRQGGERMLLPNREQHAYLKNLWQTWRVPPWQRATIPLLYQEETLIGIVGYAIANTWQATGDEWGWEVQLGGCPVLSCQLSLA